MRGQKEESKAKRQEWRRQEVQQEVRKEDVK
jgi:hypothetical protein